MKPSVVFALIFLPLLGCDRLYYLPGHNDDNLHSPPDVTMRVGERRLALKNGLSVNALTPAELYSENPKIVAIEMPDQDTAFILALAAGSARVHYNTGWEDDKGFVVHVVPAK